jgi:hypothetical protein
VGAYDVVGPRRCAHCLEYVKKARSMPKAYMCSSHMLGDLSLLGGFYKMGPSFCCMAWLYPVGDDWVSYDEEDYDLYTR